MHILMVEDDRHLGRNAARSLARAGHAVDIIPCGCRALEAPFAAAYDCILLDPAPPGLAGTALLWAWRRCRLGVPVIIVTARDVLHLCRALGRC